MPSKNWLVAAYSELFKGHLHKLKAMTEDEKTRLSLAIERYATDRDDALRHPPKDPVKALFGHCNIQDQSSAAVRLIMSYGVNPADIPLLEIGASPESKLSSAHSSSMEDDTTGVQSSRIMHQASLI